VVLTSNCGLDTWLQFLGDEVLAAAVLDRFLHHATVFMPTLAAAAGAPAAHPRGPPLQMLDSDDPSCGSSRDPFCWFSP